MTKCAERIRRMKQIEIKAGRVYQAADGRTRKVLAIKGQKVSYRDATQVSGTTTIALMARFAALDITPAPSALARRSEP